MTIKTLVRFTTTFLTPATLAFLLVACEPAGQSSASQAGDSAALTAENAAEFVTDAEQELAQLAQESERMAWVYSTYITEDTEQLSATASKNFTARQVELAAVGLDGHGVRLLGAGQQVVDVDQHRSDHDQQGAHERLAVGGAGNDGGQRKMQEHVDDRSQHAQMGSSRTIRTPPPANCRVVQLKKPPRNWAA